MRFDLKGTFTFSGDLSSIEKEINGFISDYNKKNLTQKESSIQNVKIEKNSLFFHIISNGNLRPHNVLLNIKNTFAKEFGQKHHLGVRDIKIEGYTIEFELDKKSLKEVNIPFADV